MVRKRRVALTPEELESSKNEGKVYKAKQFLYVGKSEHGEYSEFQFGSGEASVIRTVAEIEALPEGSLILIDELENGLHPLAVQRLVDYLIESAQRRNLQAIFTTHSDYALDPLPPEAVWACLDGRVMQGRLPVEVLRALAGRIDARLAVFVEDDFAKQWVESCLREQLFAGYDLARVYAVGGDGRAVGTHKSHRQNPAAQIGSICIIDGDSEQKEDESNAIYRLPGLGPELTVLNDVLRNIDSNAALLTAGFQLPLSRQSDVVKAVRQVATTNHDPHLLFSQIGQSLGFISEVVIKGAFLNVWTQEHEDKARLIAEWVESAIQAK